MSSVTQSTDNTSKKDRNKRHDIGDMDYKLEYLSQLLFVISVKQATLPYVKRHEH